MNRPLSSVEEQRLKLGLTQRAVARALGISQPHYSKIAAGQASASPELAERAATWLGQQEPSAVLSKADASRIRELTRSIEHQLRELNKILDVLGVGNVRRVISRTRRGRPAASEQGSS